MVFNIEMVELYHGTRGPIGDEVEAGIDIIKNINPKNRGNLNGSLTDSEYVGYNFALFPPSGRVSRLPGLVVIVYQMPKDLVVDHGVISGYGSAHGFSTRDYVTPEEVSEEYLRQIRHTRDEVTREVQAGNLLFYRISSKYLIDIKRY